LPKFAIAGGAAAALAAIAISLAFALGAFDGGGGEDDSSGSAAARDTPSPEAPAPEAATDDPPPPEITPVITGSGSAGGFYYLEPVPLVPGRYDSPLASREAWDRGLAAVDAEKAKPKFEGVVNGFRIWSYDHEVADDIAFKVVCGGEDYAEWRLAEKLEFTYLPPGTAAETPQQEVLCPDGSVAGAGQHFIVLDGPGLGIWYERGERAFGFSASVGRISAGKVQGRPAVIINPLTEEGFGDSWVAFETEDGFIWIQAIDLPLDEMLKIAEGVRCGSC
jgi:hypothetical protein